MGQQADNDIPMNRRHEAAQQPQNAAGTESEQNNGIPGGRPFAAAAHQRHNNDIPINRRHTAGLREDVLTPLARPARDTWLPAIVVCMLAAFTLVAIIAIHHSRGREQAPITKQSGAPLRARDISTRQMPNNRPATQSPAREWSNSQSSTAYHERTGQGGATTTVRENPPISSPSSGTQPAQRTRVPSWATQPQPVASRETSTHRFGTPQKSTSNTPASTASTTDRNEQRAKEDAQASAARKNKATPPERPRADARVPLLPPPPDFSKTKR